MKKNKPRYGLTPSMRYRYDPYGNLGATPAGSLAAANLYRFSSKEYHANSGMYYYGYRWYDPNGQRWLSRDPIGEEGGVNLYEFVYNAPVSRVDLLGLCALLPDSGPGTFKGNAVPHKLLGAEASTLTFVVCCPRPTSYLATYGLSSTSPPPPITANGNTFPASYTLVSITGGDNGDQRCYTIILRVPTTHGVRSKAFVRSIRVVGGCCCDRTGVPQRSDPPPTPPPPPGRRS